MTARATPSSLAARVLLVAVALIAAALGPAAPASAAPMDLGFRDHSYGTSVTAPTGTKPQSKLWHADGSWWGVLWNAGGKRFTIHRFEPTTEATSAWTSTGVVVDVRRNSQADVLWDEAQRRLYVVTHLKDTDTATNDRGLRFLRYGYSGGTYALEVTKTVADRGVEAAVLDKDSTGRLWATWTEPNGKGGRTVKVTHSTASDTTWTAPVTLPVSPSATETSADDLSTLVAYGDAGGRRIGVLWSNERTSELYFASRADGDPDTRWSLTTLCSTALCPDDHLNIKSIDSDASGHLYAVVKTSLNDKQVKDPDDPLMVVYRLDPAGTWTSTVAWTVGEDVTRAIVVLDAEGRRAHLFAAGPCCSGGTVYTKSSSFDDLRFARGLGTPFLRSERLAQGEAINNVTSTKQTVDGRTGLLVLGSIDKTRDYVHRLLPLAAVDTTAPTATATSPADGAAGVDVAGTVSATFSEPLRAASVSGSTVVLRERGGDVVLSDVVLAAGGTTAVLRPRDPLAAGTQHVATVSGGAGGVTDVAGNPLARDLTWTFTTGTAPVPESPAPTAEPASAGPTSLGEVARGSAGTASSTLTLTTSTALSAGTRVLVSTGYSGVAGVTARASDDVGSAWSTVAVKDNGGSTGATSALLTAVAGPDGLPAGTRITVTLSASVTYRMAVAHAYSGAATVVATSVGTGGTAAVAAPAVTAQQGDVLHSVRTWNSGTVTHQPGAGLTELAELVAGTKTSAVTQRSVAAAGPVDDAGTLSAAVVWTDAAVLLRG